MSAALAYAVGRVRVLERGLIGRAGLERLLEVRDMGQLCDVLGDMGWGDAYTPRQLERLARAHVRDARALLRGACPGMRAADCFCYECDVHNLKLLIKSRALERKCADDMLMEGGTVQPGRARYAVARGQYGEYPPEIAVQADLLERELRAGRAALTAVDLSLDRAMYRQIDRDLRLGAPGQVRRYFRAQVDMSNLITRLRLGWPERGGVPAAQYMLKGGSVDADAVARAGSRAQLCALYAHQDYHVPLERALYECAHGGDLSRLERFRDDYLCGLVEAHRWESNSIMPLVGYLIARRREAAAVGSIMAALECGMPARALRGRLSELYGE